MADFNTREQINDLALQFAGCLEEHLKLHRLYIFGSYSNGNYHADSDIDIAVVADGFTGDKVEDTFLLMRIRRNIDKRIEPHPFSVEEFTKDNPMAKEILLTGIRII